MIEETTLQTLLAAIRGGEVATLVGALLLAAVAVARRLVATRDLGRAEDWVSASAAVAAGVAVALLAGADWVAAVVLGVLAGPASAGLWDLVLRIGTPRDE